MSTPSSALPASAAPASALSTPASRPDAPWRRALREPLLHFLVLGGMLFGLDHLLVTRADDPRTIVMGPEVDAEARRTFFAARGREPSAEERAQLRQVWLDNEVLYREGMAMRVNEGDTAIRERVIFKALSVVDANTKLPPHPEDVLKTWFEAHRDKYDEPARFDFEEAALDGANAESAVRAFVTELNNGTPGDARAGLRVFKARPQPTIVQSYGAEFAKALVAATPGRWQAMHTQGGWRAIRLVTLYPAAAEDFDDAKEEVLKDWTDAILAEQRSNAVHALAKKYVVRTEAAAK